MTTPDTAAIRAKAKMWHLPAGLADDYLALCDALDAERAENEQLRKALQRIEAASQFWAEYPEGDAAIRYAHESTRRLAQAALAQKGGE